MHILILLLSLGRAFAVDPHYSILQGTSSETVVNMTVLARADERLRFDASGLPPTRVERVAETGSPWVVHRLRFENLDPERKYTLSVYENDRLRDERRFAPLNARRAGGHLAVGSCMVAQMHNPFMWNALEREKPDVLLLIGDSVYLDRSFLFWPRKPSRRLQVWNAHVRARNTVKLYFWRELKPVISIWDDHDSGFDNDDGHFPLLPITRSVFDTFFANDAIEGTVAHGPALAKSFDLSDRHIVMLDGRSYRDLEPESPLFGRLQEQWLESQIKPGLNILVTGSQFFGRFIAKDSLEYNWPAAAATFFARLKAIGDAKRASFMFVSGDIHFSELQEIEAPVLGYPTVEVTSSSLHSFGFPGHYRMKPANPRRRAATGTHNAVVLELDPSRAGRLRIRSLGWRGNDLFTAHARIAGPGCAEQLTEPGSSISVGER